MICDEPRTFRFDNICIRLLCFDTVGWAAERASRTEGRIWPVKSAGNGFFMTECKPPIAHVSEFRMSPTAISITL